MLWQGVILPSFASHKLFGESFKSGFKSVISTFHGLKDRFFQPLRHSFC